MKGGGAKIVNKEEIKPKKDLKPKKLSVEWPNI